MIISLHLPTTRFPTKKKSSGVINFHRPRRTIKQRTLHKWKVSSSFLLDYVCALATTQVLYTQWFRQHTVIWLYLHHRLPVTRGRAQQYRPFVWRPTITGVRYEAIIKFIRANKVCCWKSIELLTVTINVIIKPLQQANGCLKKL